MFLPKIFLETDLLYVFRYYRIHLIFLETIEHISRDVKYYHKAPEWEKRDLPDQFSTLYSYLYYFLVECA